MNEHRRAHLLKTKAGKGDLRGGGPEFWWTAGPDKAPVTRNGKDAPPSSGTDMTKEGQHERVAGKRPEASTGHRGGQARWAWGFCKDCQEEASCIRVMASPARLWCRRQQNAGRGSPRTVKDISSTDIECLSVETCAGQTHQTST